MAETWNLNEKIQTSSEKLQALLEEGSQKLQTLKTGALDEDAVLNLNLWYYDQFDRQIFPLYKKELTEELQKISQLQFNENTLIQNILYAYKYEAQLYNRLNQLTLYTGRFLKAIQETQFQLEENALQQGLILCNALTALNNELKTLQTALKARPGNSAIAELRIAFKQYPAHYALLPILVQAESPDKNSARFMETLQLDLQMQRELLEKLKNSGTFPVSVLLNAVEKTKNGIRTFTLDKKTPLELRSWYKFYLSPTALLLWQNIEYALSKGSDDLPAAVEKAEIFCSTLLTIITRLFLSGQDYPAFPQILQMLLNPAEDKSEEEILELTASIDHFLQTFKPGKNPPLSGIVEGIDPLLQKVKDLESRLSAKAEKGLLLGCLPEISALQEKELRLEHLLEGNRSALNNQENLAKALADLSQVVAKEQKAAEELLELQNRQLQNRQVEKSFRSLPLKIERWDLEKSTALPDSCVKRLEEVGMQHLLPQPPLPEGSIFLFTLGNENAVVIPAAAEEDQA